MSRGGFEPPTQGAEIRVQNNLIKTHLAYIAGLCTSFSYAINSTLYNSIECNTFC